MFLQIVLIQQEEDHLETSSMVLGDKGIVFKIWQKKTLIKQLKK